MNLANTYEQRFSHVDPIIEYESLDSVFSSFVHLPSSPLTLLTTSVLRARSRLPAAQHSTAHIVNSLFIHRHRHITYTKTLL